MTIEDQLMINKYKELNSANKVAIELNMPSSTVSYRLKKLGVLKKWEKQIDTVKIIESYERHQSVRKVGLEFNISHETARVKLKELGILNKPLLKYTCNEDFFSKDTPESFYWAGFIAADGCVKLKDNKHKQLSISLAQKDRNHLFKFKSILNFIGPVTERLNAMYPSSSICISSDKIFDDLKRFNIIPRKSLVLVFPKWLINHPLVNHFIRGYFDGDGCARTSISKRRTVPQLNIGFRGTFEFLNNCSNIFSSNCQIDYKKPRLNSGIFSLEYAGNRKARKITDFLYLNSAEHIRLDRKYNIIYSDFFMNLPDDFKTKKISSTNLITQEIKIFNSIKEAAQEGFCRVSISNCCRNKKSSHKGYMWKYIG